MYTFNVVLLLLNMNTCTTNNEYTHRSLAKIRLPFLHCTSRNERGIGVYTRFYSKIGPPLKLHKLYEEGNAFDEHRYQKSTDISNFFFRPLRLIRTPVVKYGSCASSLRSRRFIQNVGTKVAC